MVHVLVVDDEPSFVQATAEVIRRHGHTVSIAESIATAREALDDNPPQLLLLDLMLPDGNGLELLKELGGKQPEQVVIITGQPAIKDQITGLRGPSVSYLTKPVRANQIDALLNSVNEQAERDTINSHFGFIVGESEAMLKMYREVEQVSPTETTVLLEGESGTGKELIAQAIHNCSERQGDFVAVNCAALSSELISSELFGHERGSFTGAGRRHQGVFERAEHGTLFLDEITEMPVEQQTHLLRALETRRILRVGGEEEIEFDVRVVAATNCDPGKAVANGELREDLYFRLCEFPITLPPLRLRSGDVGLLAEFFVAALNKSYGSNKVLSKSARKRFETYDWPGNVRELRHVLHRAFILTSDSHGEIVAPEGFENPLNVDSLGQTTVGRSIRDVEKELILTTLEHFGGDKKAAAKTLGISLKTLYNRLNDYADDTD